MQFQLSNAPGDQYGCWMSDGGYVGSTLPRQLQNVHGESTQELWIENIVQDILYA